MTFRNMASSAAGMMLCAIAAFAQVAGFEGYIKGTDGKPVVGAIIKIHRTDIKGDWQTKPTDKKGHYIYNGIPAGGKFNISVWLEDKKLDELNGVPTQAMIMTQNFDLKAAKEDNGSKQDQMQKAVETGKMTPELERQLSPEQKAAIQKAIDERASGMKKRNELNDNYGAGVAALEAANAAKTPADKAPQYDIAVEKLNQAATLDPTQLAVWTHLSDAYMGLAATKTGPEHDAAIQKALDSYGKALTIKPDDASLHNNYGLALAKAGKFPDAQAELNKAAALDPAAACKYFYNLGALLTNANQPDQANEEFKKAIAADPKCSDAYYQMGVTMVAKASIGNDGKVIPVPGTVEAFQKYLEVAPTGQYAEQAKEMLTTLGSSVETSYKDPNAKTTTKKKKDK